MRGFDIGQPRRIERLLRVETGSRVNGKPTSGLPGDERRAGGLVPREFEPTPSLRRAKFLNRAQILAAATQTAGASLGLAWLAEISFWISVELHSRRATGNRAGERKMSDDPRNPYESAEASRRNSTGLRDRTC